jgi:hypothetical protein
METNPYKIAEMLNRLKPGRCYTFSADEIRDIAGTDHIFPLTGRSGWQIMLDNVVGSATPEWNIVRHGNGSVTCCRVEPPAPKLRPSLILPPINEQTRKYNG